MVNKTLPERLEHVDVVRWENGRIYVLGSSRNPSFCDGIEYGRGILFQNTHDAKTGEILEEESFEYKNPEALDNAIVLSLLGGIGIPFLIYELRNPSFSRREKSKKYLKRIVQLREANSDDLVKAISKIRVYQGTIDEVSRDLGRELERVDTCRVETFIRAKNTRDLQFRAHCLGADAIVHYQPGSAIGTPVKFKGE